ncbi:MAG: type II toxin-antitoxin system RelE/ParE family toxin [Phycisphaeraceae bacterium]
MARVVRSPTSQNDILDIALYISNDNPRAAYEWIDRLDARLNDLAQTPGVGRLRGAA